MKPSLKLGLSQQLTLTPQLRQAIRLLQLSATELEMEVREALETNPVLEMGAVQDAEQSPHAPDGTAEYPTSADTASEQTAQEPESAAPELVESVDEGDYSWEESARDMDVSHERTGGQGYDGDSDDSLESRTPVPESLTKHLLWQLHLTSMSPKDRTIAEIIIGSLEADGYLYESPEALLASLRLTPEPTLAEVEAVRRRIQQFDPVGVASRSLKECLWVQLDDMAADTPYRQLAMELVQRHLEVLARDPDGLAQSLGVSRHEFNQAIALIRRLRPRPGNPYNQGSTDYVIPDVYAVRHEGRWRVHLNPACQPSLSINRHYERLAASARHDAGNYLRGCLQEARWLIRSIKARGDTLLRTAACIVRRQTAFLEYGSEAMRPLTLREVADEIGVHESTVSRITTRKYLHTPRGTFEFKHFFSVGISTAEGGEASATAIRAMIRKLVDGESPQKPLSDNAIADELKRRGIVVARRTVAKYRESLNIPPSAQRARLA